MEITAIAYSTKIKIMRSPYLSNHLTAIAYSSGIKVQRSPIHQIIQHNFMRTVEFYCFLYIGVTRC